MTEPHDNGVVAGGPRPFNAVLRPNRSLGPRGFVVLMTCLSLASFLAGMAFVSIGAWPVFGFFGLDVLLVYIAFRLNYRSGRLYESVVVAQGRLEIARVHPSGERQSWTLEPYWARIEIDREEGGRHDLAVVSHGKRISLGAFLSPDERVAFADALGEALAPYRGQR